MTSSNKKQENPIPAKVVDLDPNVKPIPAKIVKDERSTFGRRLGLGAIIMLLLFFGISGYVSSAQNNDLLHKASRDRSFLIVTVKAQTDYITSLRAAFKKQNELLEKAGVKTVRVPPWHPPTEHPSHQSSTTPSVAPRPQSTTGPTSNPRPSSSPKPTSRPTPKPTHSPSPPPNTVDKVTKRVCSLTGICILPTRLKIF